VPSEVGTRCGRTGPQVRMLAFVELESVFRWIIPLRTIKHVARCASRIAVRPSADRLLKASLGFA